MRGDLESKHIYIVIIHNGGGLIWRAEDLGGRTRKLGAAKPEGARQGLEGMIKEVATDRDVKAAQAHATAGGGGRDFFNLDLNISGLGNFCLLHHSLINFF